VTIVKRNAVHAAVFVTLLFAVACRQGALKEPPPGQHHGKDNNRVFSVYIYTPDQAHPDQCLADWPVATLWKDLHQTVDWVSDDGGEYTVDFSGPNHSPFTGTKFHVRANDHKASGDLIQSGKYYEYAIENANGKVCKDPSDPGLYVK
jgi:hypothetical protein